MVRDKLPGGRRFRWMGFLGIMAEEGLKGRGKGFRCVPKGHEHPAKTFKAHLAYQPPTGVRGDLSQLACPPKCKFCLNQWGGNGGNKQFFFSFFGLEGVHRCGQTKINRFTHLCLRGGGQKKKLIQGTNPEKSPIASGQRGGTSEKYKHSRKGNHDSCRTPIIHRIRF